MSPTCTPVTNSVLVLHQCLLSQVPCPIKRSSRATSLFLLPTSTYCHLSHRLNCHTDRSTTPLPLINYR